MRNNYGRWFKVEIVQDTVGEPIAVYGPLRSKLLRLLLKTHASPLHSLQWIEGSARK